MTKILVVDDEPDLQILIKQKFRKKIRTKEYQFLFANNGQDAIDKIGDNANIDVVLSDINMPKMDGLTLLSELHDLSPLIKSVMVSAYGDMDNIRTAMNRGAYDFITKPINFSDLSLTLEKTIRHVRQIKETIDAIKENNILKMYVDENVLNFMADKQFEVSLTSNEYVNATVAFIDICSFTSISETEPPDVVVKLLNNYFEVMVTEITEQEGYVDKFIGDAIMAVFRGDYHLDRAIDSCLSVRSKINALPALSERLEFTPRVSIGINSGEVISGNIGSANLKRLDFTVIGQIVNTAQRLQSEAKPGQILINETSYNKVKESFKCKIQGQVKLKNISEPVTIYEVLE